MNREQYIKSLISDKGMNIKSFAAKIGMPYSTLLSMLNGSIGGAAVDNVVKICKGLDITINELQYYADDDISMESGAFSSSEIELIKKYRALSEHGKKMVDFVLSEEYEQTQRPVHILQAVARGGTFLEKELTDEQISDVDRLLEEIPPEYDGNI